MDQRPALLYVEDDSNLAYITKHNLEKAGHCVYHSCDGKDAMHIYQNHKIDLCILDVMLPEMGGFELASKIRESNSHVPIILLTAKSQLEDRIKGLQTGADDYIVKPFFLEELILKIEVFLRRPAVRAQTNLVARFGSTEFNFDELMLSNYAIEHRLTLKEAELLRFFTVNSNRVLKREDILNAVWGNDDYFLGRSLDVFVSRLRKYLSHEPSIKIENLHGIGFRFTNRS